MQAQGCIMLSAKHACASPLPAPAADALHCAALQEWSAFAQTKTARHKLTKFLKDHGHLLEPDSAQSDSSSAAEAASSNGASSTTFNDIQVTCSQVSQKIPAACFCIAAAAAIFCRTALIESIHYHWFQL